MIRFWLPRGIYEQEIRLPREAVNVLLCAAVHEAGHAQVAKHFGARVLGVALGWEVANMRAMALYALPRTLSVKDTCTVLAAGSAGELLHFGAYTDDGASGTCATSKHSVGRFSTARWCRGHGGFSP